MAEYRVYGQKITDPEINQTLDQMRHSIKPEVQQALKKDIDENVMEVLANPDGSLTVNETDRKLINDSIKDSSQQIQARQLQKLALFFLKEKNSHKEWSGFATIDLNVPESNGNAEIRVTPSGGVSDELSEVESLLTPGPKFPFYSEPINDPSMGIQQLPPEKYQYTWIVAGKTKTVEFNIPTSGILEGRRLQSIGIRKIEGKPALVIGYSIGSEQRLAVVHPPNDENEKWWVEGYTKSGNTATLAMASHTYESLQALIHKILPSHSSSQAFASATPEPTDQVSVALAQTILPDKNGVFVPHSLLDVILMLLAGAREDVRQKAASRLGFQGDFTTQLQAARAGRNGFVGFNRATRVFGPAFTSDYTRLIQDHFDPAGPQVLNFSNPENARRFVNQQMSNAVVGLSQTTTPPPELFQRGDIIATTRFVVASSLSFKEKWLLPFDKNGTITRDFQITDQKTVPAQMMSQKASFRYGETEDGAQIVALPYQDQNTFMMVVLPPEGKTISMPNESSYRQLLGQLHSTKLYIALPKFKLETTIDAPKAFQNMGLEELINGKTNYSGMISGGPIERVVVRMRTSFEIDEEGAKGDSTAGGAGVTMSVSHDPIVDCNRPFYFAVVRKEGGQTKVLFQGQVKDPSKP